MTQTSEPQIKRRQHVTGEARAALARDLGRKYTAGASIRTLMDETGRSYGFIHKLLTGSGVQLRDRGGKTRTTT